MQTVDMNATYNEQAEAFAQKSSQLLTWKYTGKPAFDKLLAEFFNRPDVLVLDLGCASGRVEEYLMQNGIPGENITGVEISDKEVEIGQTRFPDVNFRVGDIRTVELPQDTYDLAISHMVFEHIDDEGLLAASTNAYNALKPGGTFAFVVTHPGKMTAADGITEKGWFEVGAPWGGTLQNWFRSVEDFVSILQSAGFEVELVEDCHMQEEAALEDPEKYARYHSYGPMRLAVKAHKSI